MKNTPEFTDTEIQNMMDFSQVLAMAEAAKRQSKRTIRRIVSTVLIVGLLSTALYVYNRYSSPEPVNIQSPQADVPQSEEPQKVDEQATTPADSTTQEAISEQRDDSRKKPVQKPVTKDKKANNENTPSVQVDSVKSAFLPAEPVDGYEALYSYFARELRYPQQAIKDSTQGVILVSFVINTKGKPEQVTTDRALGEAFEKEAIRLIENMPAWKPAQLDGEPVRSKASVPITFTVTTNKQ